MPKTAGETAPDPRRLISGLDDETISRFLAGRKPSEVTDDELAGFVDELIANRPREAGTLEQIYAQAPMRLAAGFANRLAQTAVTTTEELTNLGVRFANLFPGKDSPLLRVPRFNLVQELEKQGILAESNLAMKTLEKTGDVAGFVAPFSMGSNALKLTGLARHAVDAIGMGALSAAEARREARLGGYELSPQDAALQGAIGAGSLGAGAVLGRGLGKVVERLARGNLSAAAKRAIAQGGLGAAFEGAGVAFDGKDTSTEEALSAMAAGAAGFNLAETMGVLFAGKLRPLSKRQVERSAEVALDIAESQQFFGPIKGAVRRPSFFDELTIRAKEEAARNYYETKMAPVVEVEGLEIRVEPEDLVRYAGIPLDRATEIMRDPVPIDEIVQVKRDIGKLIVARERGGRPGELETALENKLLDRATRKGWEKERQRFSEEERKKLVVTDEELDRALENPALVREIESETERSRLEVLRGGPIEEVMAEGERRGGRLLRQAGRVEAVEGKRAVREAKPEIEAGARRVQEEEALVREAEQAKAKERAVELPEAELERGIERLRERAAAGKLTRLGAERRPVERPRTEKVAGIPEPTGKLEKAGKPPPVRWQRVKTFRTEAEARSAVASLVQVEPGRAFRVRQERKKFLVEGQAKEPVAREAVTPQELARERAPEVEARRILEERAKGPPAPEVARRQEKGRFTFEEILEEETLRRAVPSARKPATVARLRVAGREEPPPPPRPPEPGKRAVEAPRAKPAAKLAEAVAKRTYGEAMRAPVPVLRVVQAPAVEMARGPIARRAVVQAEAILGKKATGGLEASRDAVKMLSEQPEPKMTREEREALVEKMEKEDQEILDSMERSRRKRLAVSGGKLTMPVAIGIAAALVTLDYLDDETLGGPALAAGPLLGLGSFGKGPKRPVKPVKINPGARPLEEWTRALAGEHARFVEKAKPIEPRTPAEDAKEAGKKPGPRRQDEDASLLNDLVREAKAGDIETLLSESLMPRPQTQKRLSSTYERFISSLSNSIARYDAEGGAGKETVVRLQRFWKRASRDWAVALESSAQVDFDFRWDADLLPWQRSNMRKIRGQLWKKTRLRPQIQAKIGEYEQEARKAPDDHKPAYAKIIADLKDELRSIDSIIVGDPRSDKVEAMLVAWAERSLGLSLDDVSRAWGGRRPSRKVLRGVHTLHLAKESIYNWIANEAIIHNQPFKPWQRGPYDPVIIESEVWGPQEGVFWRLQPNKQAKIRESQELRSDFIRSSVFNHNMRATSEGRKKITSDTVIEVLKAYQEARGDEAPLLNYTVEDLKQKFMGNLDLHRLNDAEIGTEIEWSRILRRYVKPAFQKIAWAEQFGAFGERAVGLSNRVKEAGYDRTQFMKLFNIASGNRARLSTSRFSRSLNELAGAVGISLLGKAPVAQVTAVPRVIEQIGLPDFFRNLLPASQATIEQSGTLFASARKALGSKELSMYAKEAGPMGQSELFSAYASMDGLLPKVAALQHRLLGTNILDRYPRNLAAIGGRRNTAKILRDYERRLVLARQGRLSSFERARLELNRQQLVERFGEDPDTLRLALEGKWSESDRRDLEILGGQIVGDRTQGRNLPIDMPLAYQDPHMAALYKLQVFAWRMTAESIRQVDPRNPTSIFRNPAVALRHLAGWTAVLGASHYLRELRRMMENVPKEDWPENPLFQEWADLIAFSGYYPLFFDAFARFGEERFGPAETQILGPMGAMALDAWRAPIQSVKQSIEYEELRTEPMQRFILESIPKSWWNLFGVPTGKQIAEERGLRGGGEAVGPSIELEVGP